MSGNGKVVILERYLGDRSLAPLRQAEAYWTALREDGDIPRRSQIDPRGLERVLEYAFILERIAPGIARFRVVGRHMNELAGMEVRGMPLTAFFAPDARDDMAKVLEQVFSWPACAELDLAGEAGLLRPRIGARMLLLPLKSDQGEISRALGVMVADGTPVRHPQRFAIRDRVLRPARGATAPRRAPDTPAAAPVAGFAEEQAPWQRRAPHLRLVKSDEEE